jgi:putative transposase
LRLHLTEGQRSDHKGAESLMPLLPDARVLIADKAYASRWMHRSLRERGITAFIPAQRLRKHLPPYDPATYRQRHRIEHMFAKLYDWRRIHTRYDRCADTFLAAITLAAIFIFWINDS